MSDFRLVSLAPSRRLAVGSFLLLLLGFYGLSQLQLIAAVGDGGSYPTSHDVLVKYHGDPARTRLHKVLDPSRPASDPKNMYQHLSPQEDARPALRAKVLSWVEAGMPRERFAEVAPILSSADGCASCHRKSGETEAVKPDLPFETYEQVVAGAGVDTGISVRELATSSHNHVMGFAVVALLTSLAFTATRWRGPIVPLLVVLAFAGSVVDVSSWWMTKAWGSPFEFGVLLGGGLFGAATMTMVVLALDELWFSGRVGGLVERLAKPLRLGRRDPA